jgi:opacity protein-like surface antigen
LTAVSGAKFALPASAAVGVGYEASFAEKHAVEALLDADYYFGGSFAAAAGAAYTYNDMVTVRAGYRYGGQSPVPSFASVGVGVKFIGLKLDLAYLIGSAPAANTLALSLGYTF